MLIGGFLSRDAAHRNPYVWLLFVMRAQEFNFKTPQDKHNYVHNYNDKYGNTMQLCKTKEGV